MSARKHPRKPTRLQGRQRELAWAVYIAEGYIANVAAGLDRNSRHMTPDDMRTIQRSLESVVRSALRLREKLSRVGQPV